MSEVRMQETPDYKPGMFCWVELGTSDSDSAKNFYSQLFGWEYQDNPMGPDMVAQGIPPHWLSYVLVTNADETAEKAKAAGATVLNGPFDIGTVGRMAVIKDPTEAVFAIWEPKDHQGSGIYNVPGALTWNELGTRDTATAGEFYTNVFRWIGA